MYSSLPHWNLFCYPCMVQEARVEVEKELGAFLCSRWTVSWNPWKRRISKSSSFCPNTFSASFCPNTFSARFCAAYLVQQRCHISALDTSYFIPVRSHITRLLARLDDSVAIFNNRRVRLHSISTWWIDDFRWRVASCFGRLRRWVVSVYGLSGETGHGAERVFG